MSDITYKCISYMTQRRLLQNLYLLSLRRSASILIVLNHRSHNHDFSRNYCNRHNHCNFSRVLTLSNNCFHSVNLFSRSLDMSFEYVTLMCRHEN